MTTNALRALQALNPAPSSTAPSIERLWRRLDCDVHAPVMAEDPPRPREPSTHWGSAWTSRALLAASVAIVITIAGGAGLALHSSKNGPSRSGVPQNAAALTRILGVLRRPQTAMDRTAAAGTHLFRGFVKPRPGSPPAQTITPIKALERVADLPDGQHVGLVPVRIQPSRATGEPANQVGLAVFAGGGSCCSTAAQIENGQAFSSGGRRGAPNIGVLVVPDGVASVSVALPQPSTVTVHENIAVIKTTADLENLSRYGMAWYAPNGSVVKHFAPGRTVKPTSAQVKAQRKLTLSIAEHRHVATRPDIRAFYPVFDATFPTSRIGSGATGYTLSHPTVTQIPTNAIADAGEVPKYATNARNERLLQIGTGLKLWLAAGGRICIYGKPAEDAACTPEGTPRTGLLTQPPRQPSPHVAIALVPHNNATITLNTTTGSYQAPVHDGLIVILAAHLRSVRYKTSNGRSITRTVHLH